MIAFAPCASASSIIRCRTCSRLSISAFVIPFSSPPTSDLKPAPICEPRLRERTVRPNTSPSVSVISHPVRSFAVVISIVSPFLHQLPQLGQRACVRDLIGGQPRAARLGDAEVDVVERLQLV